MEQSELAAWREGWVKRLNEELSEAIKKPMADEPPEVGQLLSAMNYTLESGGKRLRALLVLAAAEAVGGQEQWALPGALAVEMIHAYSLIHDDLPALDNDDLRRGRPTCHLVYGEALAILAGDALQALAFETLASALLGDLAEPTSRVSQALLILAKAIGPLGMVGGQAMDLAFEGARPELTQIITMESKKTGFLMGSCLALGATLGGADQKTISAFESSGRLAGLAFQISDDQLNVTGDAQLMGKNVGTDAQKAKASVTTLISQEQASEQVSLYIKRAMSGLRPFNSPKLEWLIGSIFGRSS
ncbi:MAG: polyprenyl synthetase family protein [Deltaproteobacteria bacterium]|jgi:geranylgeranyl pyrophosphate synthase|nr:polyprenyl synthetase family protein [Deltaproteobacteria bacterium]